MIVSCIFSSRFCFKSAGRWMPPNGSAMDTCKTEEGPLPQTEFSQGQWKMTGGTPEVCSDKSLTLSAFKHWNMEHWNIWTFEQWNMWTPIALILFKWLRMTLVLQVVASIAPMDWVKISKSGLLDIYYQIITIRAPVGGNKGPQLKYSVVSQGGLIYTEEGPPNSV